MSDLDCVLEVSDALKENKAAFFVGAGVSVGRQSYLPKWEDLIFALLSIVGKDKAVVEYIKAHHMGLLFNEVFLLKMAEVIGVSQTASAIRACLETNAYSAIHKFFAWASVHFSTPILTTNYDELIEQAGGKEQNLLKLHGTLSNIEQARFTVRHIYAPLEDRVVQRAKEMLDGRVLVVAGYRGADEFDVIPFLFHEAAPEKVIWLVHGDIDERSVDQSVLRALDDARWPYLSVNTDDFFADVYGQLKPSAPFDAELDSWHSTHKGNEADWWLSRLRVWDDNLEKDHRNELLLLWARILDYLRISSLKLETGTERQPAVEAYTILVDSPDPILSLEAQVRIPYIRRTAGRETTQNILVDLQKVIAKIWNALDECWTDERRKSLLKLLGWATHQYGVSLQNVGAYHSATVALEEATKIRRLLGDAELPYSVFSLFMNGAQASLNKAGHVDEVAPSAWRLWLLRDLERYAEAFLQTFEPEHHGNTIHNIAYVHQFLGMEHEEHLRFDEAYSEFSKALELDEDAKNIRERLRDPRMIAQSDVRIAECKLGLARHEYRNGEYGKVLELIAEGGHLANGVEELYERMEQESFRVGDVGAIQREVERLRKECEPYIGLLG